MLVQPAKDSRQDLGEPAAPMIVGLEATIKSEHRMQETSVDVARRSKTRISQPFRQGFDGRGELVPLPREAVPTGVERCHHRHLGGRGVRRGREHAVEYEALLRERVELRSGVAWVAVDAEMIGAKRVERDEHDLVNRLARRGGRRIVAGEQGHDQAGRKPPSGLPRRIGRGPLTSDGRAGSHGEAEPSHSTARDHVRGARARAARRDSDQRDLAQQSEVVEGLAGAVNDGCEGIFAAQDRQARLFSE